MRIKFIVVGKLNKDNQKLFDLYTSRIKHYSNVHITEIKEIKDNNVNLIKQKETFMIEKAIPKNANVYLCSLQGEIYSSLEFAKILNVSNIVFIIGGSYGFDETKFTKKIKFSDMTFPHQLFRVILAEQIFRGLNINNNGKYHK